MKKVELFILPNTRDNRVRTRLIVDGSRIDSKDNRLTNLVVCQPMGRWLNPYKKKLFVWRGFLAEMIDEFNDKSMHFVFHGCRADFTLFRRSILAQKTELNRNGSGVDAEFDLIDDRAAAKAVNCLMSVLDELYTEADNWGEDDTLKAIDQLRSEIAICQVGLLTEYCTSPDTIRSELAAHDIGVSDDALVTVVPVDASVPGACGAVGSLAGRCDGRKYIILNTAPQDDGPLFDAVISSGCISDPDISYIEIGGDHVLEIGLICYRYSIPGYAEKAEEILRTFPDHDTNPLLIEAAGKLSGLSRIAK